MAETAEDTGVEGWLREGHGLLENTSELAVREGCARIVGEGAGHGMSARRSGGMHGGVLSVGSERERKGWFEVAGAEGSLCTG